MADGTRTLPRSEGPPAPPEGDSAGIGCRCDFYELNPELHDELLGFESRGIAGVEWLGDYLDQTEDCDPPADTRLLHWRLWDDFVAEHNWADPLAVARVSAHLMVGIHHRVNLEARAGCIEAKLIDMIDTINALERRPEVARSYSNPPHPPADLSEENVTRLVEALPAAVVAEIDATAVLAEHLAWSVTHLLGRWEALQDAICAAVGSERVWNGGELACAVQDRTRARVTDEVFEALGLNGSEQEDGWREVLEGHALLPDRDERQLRTLIRGAMVVLVEGVGDAEETRAFIQRLGAYA